MNRFHVCAANAAAQCRQHTPHFAAVNVPSITIRRRSVLRARHRTDPDNAVIIGAGITTQGNAMGKANRRRKHSTANTASGTDYRELEELARTFVVKHLLETTPSPELRRLNRRLMAIDPTGKLLCAYYHQMRHSVDHALARKVAGGTDADIAAAFDRDLALWLAKGPEKIIAEFEEQMGTQAAGLPAGAPTH
jgi:hypothetical protein